MLINELPKVMIISLTCTLIIELAVAILLKYRGKDLINILLANIVTNPLLNSVLVSINYFYGIKIRNIFVIVFEVLVVFVEGIIYKKYLKSRKINEFLLSIILNMSSYFLGLLINNIIYR